MDARGGQEFVERPARPHRRAGRQVKVEAPEREQVLSRGDDDVLPAAQPLRQRAVIDRGCQPRPRIERVGQRLALPSEEKGVGVDRRREVVGAGLGVLRMKVRQLRKGKEPVLSALSVEARVKLRESGPRLVLESLPQVEALEHLLGELAQRVAGQRAGGHLPSERLRRDRLDPDRRGACRGKEHADPEKSHPARSSVRAKTGSAGAPRGSPARRHPHLGNGTVGPWRRIVKLSQRALDVLPKSGVVRRDPALVELHDLAVLADQVLGEVPARQLAGLLLQDSRTRATARHRPS